MRAMRLYQFQSLLKLEEVPIPEPSKKEVLIKVAACGICRTDLHILDGELIPPLFPLILGHQIVGIIVKRGEEVEEFNLGDRVGIPWLAKSCQECDYCRNGKENLCEKAYYTGYHIDGGFAEYCVADSSFIFSIPSSYSAVQAAPLLCGGLIGYRSLRPIQEAQRIGFYGFGSSAHILIQILNYQGRECFVFTRKGDSQAQSLAKKLGARWAGSSEEKAPVLLDAALIFAPVGALIPVALGAVKKGGKVICAGIHMSAIPSFPYEILYGEKQLQSVTNLTRQDGNELLELAPQIPIEVTTTLYPLEKANQALDELRTGKITGSAVLSID